MSISSASAREEVRRALRTARARLPDLFAPSTRLVVGFSGGQDSTALLHALARPHLGLHLIAAHVDHALKADSATVAARAQDLAADIGISCETVRVDVNAYRQQLPGGSMQQAARAARYQALGDVVQKHQAAALLVAHTADDQAETLLLHLLRGSGLTGLTGMRLEETFEPLRLGPPLSEREKETPLQKLRLVRPLLRVSRATTLAYCTLHGLAYIDDASNQSRAYTRNRVRLDLMPVLEQFNPAVRTVLARTAELAAEDEATLDQFIARTLEQLEEQKHTFRLDLWRAQNRAVQRRLLRLSLRQLVGQTTDMADAPIEDALDLLQTARPNQTYHLPYGVELCVSSERFSLESGGRARPRATRNTWEGEVPRV